MQKRTRQKSHETEVIVTQWFIWVSLATLMLVCYSVTFGKALS